MKRLYLFILCLGYFLTLPSLGFSEEAEEADISNISQLVYFTGIGCPHCARVDPVLLTSKVPQGDILIVEYEIYQQRENAALLMAYNDAYGTGLSIPLLIGGGSKDDSLLGDTPILKNMSGFIKEHKGNQLPLLKGAKAIADLSIQDLPGLPKIWFKNRVAAKNNSSSTLDSEVKDFLLRGVIPSRVITNKNTSVTLSGSTAKFSNSYELEGWTFYTNKEQQDL